MKSKVKLILSLAALALCAVLIVVQVFAWVAMDSDTSLGGISLGIVGLDDADSDISVELGRPVSEGAALLLPGEYVTAKITIVNNGGTDKKYALFLEKCTVRFPTYSKDFVYGDKYIDVDSYYLDGAPYDFRSDAAFIASPQQFFRGFATPVTDALNFNVSACPADRFEGGYLPLSSFTAAGYASERELTSEMNDYLPLTQDVPINDYGLTDGVYTDAEGNTVTVTDGKAEVPAGGKVNLYMLIYYDPLKTAVNAEGIELRNSNAFLSQRVWLTVSAVSSV